MAQAVIVDSVRTGLAKSFRGGFNQTRADDMTAHIIDALMDRNPEIDPTLVEDVMTPVSKLHTIVTDDLSKIPTTAKIRALMSKNRVEKIGSFGRRHL